MDLQSNKVAVVTGASRGIGRATARALAAAGIRVFLVADGTEEELESAIAECRAAHPAKVDARYGIFIGLLALVLAGVVAVIATPLAAMLKRQAPADRVDKIDFEDAVPD